MIIPVTPQATFDRPALSGRNSRAQIFRDLAAVVSEIRQEAKEKGLDKMSKREMHAAVSSARKTLARKAGKQAAR
jgi:hypothetical protein